MHHSAAVGYNLLQEVHDLLGSSGISSSAGGRPSPLPQTPQWTPSDSLTAPDDGSWQHRPIWPRQLATTPTAPPETHFLQSRESMPTVLSALPTTSPQHQQRVRSTADLLPFEQPLQQHHHQQAWTTPLGKMAPHHNPRNHNDDVVEASIAETLDPDHQAFAVIDALLTTARHNTDLTELDLVCRRVRQSEIERLSEALEHLHKYDAYVKKRCNVLYDAINAVNDQQAQLVACLEAALQASTTADARPSSPVLSDRGVAAEHLQQQHQHSQQLAKWGAAGKRMSGGCAEPMDDQASLPGSLRPSRLAGAISSSSSQSGRYGRLQQQSSSPPQPAVTPYRVVGGPLNRHTLETVLSH